MSIKWFSNIRNTSSGWKELSCESIAETNVHSCCQREHVCDGFVNVLDKTGRLAVATEEQGKQIFVNLPPINCNPIVVLQYCQKDHTSSNIVSYLFGKLLKKLSYAIAKSWANESAQWHCIVKWYSFVILFFFLILFVLRSNISTLFLLFLFRPSGSLRINHLILLLFEGLHYLYY